jgi:SPP1 gp7 family putative phage head morphogenesis protein
VSLKQEIDNLLEAVNEAVARLPDSVLREFIPVLKAAERELAAGLAKLGLGNEDKFTAHQYRRALVQIRHALRQVKDLRPELEGVLSGSIPHVTLAAIRYLQEDLVRFGNKFGSTIEPVAIDVAAAISHGEEMLIPRYEASAARYAGQVFQDIKRQLAIGVVKGETFGQVARRLANLGSPFNPLRTATAEDAAAGLFRRAGHAAERLVRTEVLNAYNSQFSHVLKEANEEDPGYLQRWDGSIDRRICPTCRDLDGQTVKLGQSFRGGYSHPPAHPNCRCALVAWRRDWSF